VPVTLWDREAVDASKYLGDGSKVAVRAHIHSRVVVERPGNDGKRLRLLYVIAERVTYLDVRAPRAGGRP